MYSIDPEKQQERDNYKIMTGAIIPRPVAFVLSKSSEGIVNAAPFSYFNIVSANPPLISVSIQRKNGVQKDSAKNMIDTKQFVVHVTTEGIVENVNHTAAPLEHNDSELRLTDLTLVDSDVIDVPGVAEAPFWMECTLSQHITDDNYASFDLMIGKVERFHIDEAFYDKTNGHVDALGLKAISRLAGNDYAKVGEKFTLARPQ